MKTRKQGSEKRQTAVVMSSATDESPRVFYDAQAELILSLRDSNIRQAEPREQPTGK